MRNMASKRGDLVDHFLDRVSDVLLSAGIGFSVFSHPAYAFLGLQGILLTSFYFYNFIHDCRNRLGYILPAAIKGGHWFFNFYYMGREYKAAIFEPSRQLHQRMPRSLRRPVLDTAHLLKSGKPLRMLLQTPLRALKEG